MGSLIAISGWRSPFAAPIADALIRQGNSVLALLHDEAVPSNTDRSVSFIKLLVNSGDTASVKRELDGLVLNLWSVLLLPFLAAQYRWKFDHIAMGLL